MNRLLQVLLFVDWVSVGLGVLLGSLGLLFMQATPLERAPEARMLPTVEFRMEEDAPDVRMTMQFPGPVCKGSRDDSVQRWSDPRGPSAGGSTVAYRVRGDGNTWTVPGQRLGGRRPEEIAREVGRHDAATQYCYRRQRSTSPDRTGVLKVSFEIDETGAVGGVESIAIGVQESVVECVEARVLRMRFQRGPGRVRAEHRFVFAPSGR